MSWARFRQQYDAQGREKGDGYDASHFADLDADELDRARTMMLERGLSGDTIDLSGLRLVGDPSVVAALQDGASRDKEKGIAFETARRETLFALTGEADHLEPLFLHVDGNDPERARRAAEALARHPLPARLAGPLARRLMGGRHERIRDPLLYAWLCARGVAIWTPGSFERELPFIRAVLKRRPARRASLLAAWPDHDAASGHAPTLARRLALLGLVAALAAGAGSYRYLQTMPVGTGETRVSPDGRFTASVMDWSERGFLTGTPRRWFRYRIDGPGVHHDLVGEPVPGPYFGSRSSHRVIRWSADSSAVEFVFPDTSLRIAIRPVGD